MKRNLCLILAVIMIFALVTACSAQPSATPDEPANTAAAKSTEAVKEPAASENNSTDTSENDVDNSADTASANSAALFDPYSTENNYNIPSYFFEKQDGVDYGTIDEGVIYYSAVAGDYKRCNVLLPAGYDSSNTYPVLYMIHGWGGDYKSHVYEDSYLTLLYGNMLNEGLTQPMIIVGVDMYTGILSEKENVTDEELRFIYDKVIDDIPTDLMPFIEANYSVKTGRINTAVAGVSQGGAESLATGFKSLDSFAYIAGIAPDTGVIPTEWYKGTFWNTPIFEEFPQPTAENMPSYLYMSVGSEDPWNIDCTLYYSEVLDEMGVKNQTDYVEGYAHDSDFWGVSMYQFLTKIFK